MIGEEYLFTRSDGAIIHGLKWPNGEAKAKIVIVTGMEEHASRYEDFAKFLMDQGYEIYCLDHLGQGANASDEKKLGVWPIGAFEYTVDTVAELIQKIKTDKPVYLFGHSLGSFVSQRFIQKHGQLIDKVVICGSNGPDFMVKIGFALASVIVGKKGYQTKSKLFNDMVFGAYANAIPNARTSFDWLSYNEDNVNRYIADPYCGYGSTGGFYKEFLRGLSHLFDKKEMARISKKSNILLIAGAEDPVGKSGQGVQKLEMMYRELGIQNIRTIIYSNMRHEILNEAEHQKVYDDVARFLNT